MFVASYWIPFWIRTGSHIRWPACRSSFGTIGSRYRNVLQVQKAARIRRPEEYQPPSLFFFCSSTLSLLCIACSSLLRSTTKKSGIAIILTTTTAITAPKYRPTNVMNISMEEIFGCRWYLAAHACAFLAYYKRSFCRPANISHMSNLVAYFLRIRLPRQYWWMVTIVQIGIHLPWPIQIWHCQHKDGERASQRNRLRWVGMSY